MSIEVVAELPSTQEELLARVAREGGRWAHLDGLRAEVQSSGRGRGGRQWETSGVRAMTVSYVLRPGAPTDQWGTLALRGGLAAVRALAGLGVDSALKWPNDVVVETPNTAAGWYGIAKVGGVLGSLVRDSEGRDVCVLGIGINLEGEVGLQSGAALGIDTPAHALAMLVREELAQLVPEGSDDLPAIDHLMERHCHTLGRGVVVSFPAEVPPREIRGRAVAIGEDGALVVEGPGGRERVLNGDIGHTRLDPTVGWDA